MSIPEVAVQHGGKPAARRPFFSIARPLLKRDGTKGKTHVTNYDHSKTEALGPVDMQNGFVDKISALARAQKRDVRDDRTGFRGRGTGFIDQTWIAYFFDPAGYSGHKPWTSGPSSLLDDIP
jgi:hypothetical protein